MIRLLCAFSIFSSFILVVYFKNQKNNNLDNASSQITFLKKPLVADKIPIKGAILGSLIDDVFKQLVPLSINTSEGEMTLIDISYCILEEKPRLIAVLIPKLQDSSNFKPTKLIDCNKSLSDIASIAKSSYANSTWLAAIVMDLVWIPWEIKLKVKDVSVIGNSSPVNGQISPSYLLNLKQNDKELYSISTNHIKINIGNKQSINYKFILSFKEKKINLFGLPIDADVNVALDTVGKTISSESLPKFTNSIISISDYHINNIANTYFKNTKIPVNLGNPQRDSLVLDSLNVAAADDNLNTYTLLHKNGETENYNGTTVWKGSDLALSNIDISANLKDCGPRPSIGHPDDLAKWTACKGKNLALQTLGNAISSNIRSKYRGKLLRPIDPNTSLKVNLNNKDRECSIITLSCKSIDKNVLLILNTILK